MCVACLQETEASCLPLKSHKGFTISSCLGVDLDRTLIPFLDFSTNFLHVYRYLEFYIFVSQLLIYLAIQTFLRYRRIAFH